MVKLLIKNRFSAVISAMLGKSAKNRKSGTKKAGVGKIIGFTFLYVYLIACFLFLSTSMALSLAETVLKSGAAWFYFGTFMLVDLAMVFFFSIFETKSELFECKDNDLLLSMPIKPQDIVVSRISVVMIYNYLEELVIMLPSIIVYAVYTRDMIGVIGAVIVSLFIPLISTALSSAVGYLIAMISRKIRRKTLVTTLISVAFILVFFFAYTAMLNNMDSFMEGGGSEIIVLPESAPILYHVGSAALLKPLNISALILLSVAFAALAFFIISKNYIKITTYTGVTRKAVYKGEIVKRKSALAALINKELKRFFSSTAYMTNGAIGIIFTLIFGVIAVFNRAEFAEISSMLVSSGFAEDFLSPLMICAIVMFSSMNMQSASALSLEGKNLWCVKSMPVSDREVLLSKAMPQIVVTVPPTVITSILFMIATSAPAKYWAFYILTPITANVFFAFLGLVMNVAFPKFDYENEVQPIKQSMPVFLAMMSQMVIGLLAIGINVLLSIIGFGILAAFLTLGVFIGLTVAFYFILVGPCARKYRAIEP